MLPLDQSKWLSNSLTKEMFVIQLHKSVYDLEISAIQFKISVIQFKMSLDKNALIECHSDTSENPLKDIVWIYFTTSLI